MKEIKTKYCAIKYADNGTCEDILECKNLTEKEYAKLKNQGIEHKQEELKKEEIVNKRLANIETFLSKHNLLIAKGIYDNFVDRGLIEDDKEFQDKWYDYVIKGQPLDLEYCPDMFRKIFEFVCEGDK